MFITQGDFAALVPNVPRCLLSATLSPSSLEATLALFYMDRSDTKVVADTSSIFNSNIAVKVSTVVAPDDVLPRVLELLQPLLQGSRGGGLGPQTASTASSPPRRALVVVPSKALVTKTLEFLHPTVSRVCTLSGVTGESSTQDIDRAVKEAGVIIATSVLSVSCNIPQLDVVIHAFYTFSIQVHRERECVCVCVCLCVCE